MDGSPSHRQTPGSFDFEDELHEMAYQSKNSSKGVESSLEKLLASPVSSLKDGSGEAVMHINSDVVKQLIDETMKLCKSIEALETSNNHMMTILDKMMKFQQQHENKEANCKGKEVMKDDVNFKTFEPTKHLGSGLVWRKKPTPAGVSTVLLSDDDNNEVLRKKPTFVKGGGSGKGTKSSHLSPEDDLIRNITLGEEDPYTSKKLVFTPSPKTNCKRTRAGGSQPITPSFSPTYVNYAGAGSGSNTVYKSPTIGKVPKNFKCKFRPTNKMRLSQQEAKVCAYVFADENAADAPPTHHSDLVFNMNTYFALRSDFDCLVPGGIIGKNIITMTAMYVTWNQTQTMSKHIWCLPPKFAMDVAQGVNVTRLLLEYADDWLPTFPHLKLIYVPIADDEHWFLMVIKLDEMNVYHLDTNLLTHKVEPRIDMIRKICTAMSEIALSRYTSDVPNCAYPEFNRWEIVEPRGIPQFGHSLNSGLWVTEWMNMQNAFNNQILGMMEENWARMKIAMRLLLGAHNESKQMLLADANQFWHDVMNGPYSTTK